MNMWKRFLPLAALGILPALLLSGCATLAPCPGSLLPIVEIQVNNSASNHDDYGTTGANTACRARITNPTNFNGGANFPGGVTIELRNAAGFSNLLFSTTALGAGSGSIFQTLPGNGSWSAFYVKGTGTSTVDKSAVIEMATSGTCDETVIARKAMMIPSGAPPIAASPAQQFEIEINQTSATLDDYVAWAPLPSRIRWTNGVSGNTTTVRLQNMSGTDHLRFAIGTLAGGTTATLSNVNLTLNGDGAWSQFYVAGNFASPSVRDKDAVIEVVDAGSSTLLSREGMMVRIRKNANNITTAERDRYLNALGKVNMTYGLNALNADYITFVRTHSRGSSGAGGSNIAHTQAHKGSAFLPWHRAFVLHLERLLQSADPSVALPYWKFDEAAPNVLASAFMGTNSAGNFVTLDGGNPIASWALAGEGVAAGIQRKTPYSNATGHPSVLDEPGTLALGGAGFTFANFRTMEVSTHNPAHSTSGANSWIANLPSIATRDPLFFFLHCNVDRLWAKWQWLHVRNDVTSTATYDLLGSVTAPAAGVALPDVPSNRMLGQYADDTMWPWDNVINGSGTSQRPDIALLQPFPIVLGGVLPFAHPTVKGVIDYAGVTSTSAGTMLNFGYDDVNPFQP